MSEFFPVFARDGSPILAGPASDPSSQAIRLARVNDPLLFARATELQPPTGVYNCHGLVFASRRAGIPPIGVEVDIEDLLHRDGYRRLSNDQAPQVGDIVAYRLDKEIEHTGFVTDNQDSSVRVWSAWGSLGEYEHGVYACPYRGIPEYWRLTCP